jgi:hypothetical protein
LAAIHNYAAAALGGRELIDGTLPPTNEYFFDDAGAFMEKDHHDKMLFLGEDDKDGLQPWAQLKINSRGLTEFSFSVTISPRR